MAAMNTDKLVFGQGFVDLAKARADGQLSAVVHMEGGALPVSCNV